MRNRFKGLSDWLYFFGIMPALACLPRRVGYGFVPGQGRRLFKANSKIREEATRNISLALDDSHWTALEKEEVLHRFFDTVAAQDLDVLYLPFWSEKNIRFNCRFEGLQHLEQSQKQGKGVLLFTGNFGSVPSAITALAFRGYKIRHFIPFLEDVKPPTPAFRAFENLRTRWVKKSGS